MLRTSDLEHWLPMFARGLESSIRKMACQNRMRVLEANDQRAGDRDGELGKR